MRVNSVFRAALKSGVDTSSNLLSDSKSSVTKSYDIFFRRILRLLWLSEISQRKSFQLEMCLPGRLSRSNDFWSAKRNWFHYFQIIKQRFLKLSCKEKVSANTVSSFPKCYKKSDGSQDAPSTPFGEGFAIHILTPLDMRIHQVPPNVYHTY